MNIRAIDLNSYVMGCDHIKWGEVLWLPQYRMYAHPTNEQHIANLIDVCKRFEKIRHMLGGHSINISSGYRPGTYNKKIGGAEKSAHREGMALDLVHSKFTADECRDKLLPHLEVLKIRMEDLPGSSWIHIDTKTPYGARYFKP